MALTKVITDVIDDSIRISSGSLANISGSAVSTGSVGRLEVAGTSADLTVAGDVTVTGRITTKEFQTEFVSASITLATGSNVFGDTTADTHKFTGSLLVTGSLEVDSGDAEFSGNVSGSATSTGSFGSIVTAGTGVTTFTGGKVGIGTNAPQTGRLHIHDGSSGATSYVQLTQDGTGAASGDGLLVGVNAAEASIIYNAENTPLIFYTNTNERVRITNAGDVGIGTNSPDAGLDLRDTMKLQTNTVPASLIVGTNDTTDHTGEDSALAIDFRNLSTTNGVAGGLVGLDKDGLELSKILLVTDNHDANTSSIRMFTSTNASQRTQMVNINNDGVTVGGGASAQRALHVQGTTGMCLSDGDRDRAALLPISPDAANGGLAINIRSGSASHERARVDNEGNVGIGTNSPLTALHVHGTAGDPASSGTTPTAIARIGTTGLNSVLDIGQGASPYPMFLQSADRSNLAQFYELSLNPVGGNVGIGTLNPGTALEVHSDGNSILTLNADRTGTSGQDNAGIYLENQNSSVWAIRYSSGDSNRLEIYDAGFDDGVQLAQNGSGFSDISDERAKTDFVTITDAVDKINSLRAVNFKWKYGNEERRTKNNVGIIAQDVYKVLPEAVYIPENDYKVVDHPIYEGEKQAQNLWTVDKSKLTILLIKAVQELSEKVESQQKQIEELEK